MGFFDTISPFKDMKRCVVDDNLNVLYYLYPTNSALKADGVTPSKLDGTDGQVMVEIPAFYYQHLYDGTSHTWSVSGINKAGFKLHPWFVSDIDGSLVPKRYFSAFEGSIFDVSASVYLLTDQQVADFTVGTGDKLCSIAGAKPCSGLTQNLTLPNTRILANNRGSKWQQLHFNAVSAIQILMLAEYGTLDIQNRLSQGVTNITDDSTTNMAINTGATVSLGNVSGQVAVTHYQTGQTTYACSYRGIENFYGNIWSLVDGINIKNLEVYLTSKNSGFISDKFDTNYVDTGIMLPNTNNWIQNFAYNANYDYSFLPSVVGSTQRFDYTWVNPVGNFVSILGGRWSYGGMTGAFGWSFDNGSGVHLRSIGGRLCG